MAINKAIVLLTYNVFFQEVASDKSEYCHNVIYKS